MIKAMKDTPNDLLKVEKLCDEDLQNLLKRYENLFLDIKKRVAQGKSDEGIPKIPTRASE